MSKFVVVDFFKEKTIDFVPLSWITGKNCAWPAPAKKALSKSQIRLKEDPTSVPGQNWFWSPVKIIRLCDTLEKAKDKAKRKENNPNSNLESSDPNTPVAVKRKRKPVKKYSFDEFKKSRTIHSSSSELDDLSSSDEDIELPTSKFNESLISQESLPNQESADLTTDLTFPPSSSREVPRGDSKEAAGSEFQEIQSSSIDDPSTVEIDVIGSLFASLNELNTKVDNLESVQKDILAQLVYVKEDLKVVLSSANQNIAKLREVFPSHPIKNEDELKTFEEWIGNPEQYTKAVQYLSGIGIVVKHGSDDKDSTRETVFAIMSRLFANRFADGVNFIGKNGKIEFQKSPLLQLIKDAVCSSTTANPNVTEKKIEGPIKDWFRTAKGRR